MAPALCRCTPSLCAGTTGTGFLLPPTRKVLAYRVVCWLFRLFHESRHAWVRPTTSFSLGRLSSSLPGLLPVQTHHRSSPSLRYLVGSRRARQLAASFSRLGLARMFHRRSDFVVAGDSVRFGGRSGCVWAGSGPACGDRGGLVAFDSPHKTQFGRSSTDLKRANSGNRLFAALNSWLSSAAPSRPAQTGPAAGNRCSSTPARAAR
jgi:hypothetical protein